jgi:hypothetical protein
VFRAGFRVRKLEIKNGIEGLPKRGKNIEGA